MKGKSSDGIFQKRSWDRSVVFYYKIGTNKSKDFPCQTTCAMEYVTKYVDKYPKYKEMVYDKTWDEIFALFGIKITQGLTPKI